MSRRSRRTRAHRTTGRAPGLSTAPTPALPEAPAAAARRHGRLMRHGAMAGLACVMGVAVSGLGEMLVATKAAAVAGANAGGSGSLAGAMGSLGGLVDERTGQVSFAVPLGAVTGPAGSGFGVQAQFSQLQAWSGVDRFGLGAGWSWGTPFVDVERGKLVLPSGEYGLDDKAASGLTDYRLGDVRFTDTGGSDPVKHAYQLESIKDGSRLFFDANGDPVAAQDRFGHTTTLTWQQVNGKHRLASVTGPLGARLTVAHSGSKITVTSPAATGQDQGAASVVQLSGGRVESMTDAAGNRTVVQWTNPMGDAGLVAPAAVTSPTGARTSFEYRTYDQRSGGIVAVSRVQVTGEGGRELVAPMTVSLDPDGANGGRNWTGCPEHCADGTDQLARSGDAGYTYRVLWEQQGTRQQDERTYNALHQKTGETSRIRDGGQHREVSRVGFSYPGVTADRVPPVQDAPANYQTPSGSTITTVDPKDPSRTREAAARTSYDSLGRVTSQEAGGVRTTTEYGANSQATRTESTDLKTGAQRVVENSLTPDGKAIAESVTRAAEPGAEPVVVSTDRYRYHDGQLAGEVAEVRTTGTEGAKDDPGEVVSEHTTDLRTDAPGLGTRTDTATGPNQVPATTVTDLATGRVLSQKVGEAPQSTAEYDKAGRVVKTTGADGSVTTVDYQVEPSGTTTTTTRQSDGMATRTHSDELGRTVATESNYRPSDGRIGDWRQTSAAGYDSSGRQTSSTDAAGKATTTTYDAYSRPSMVTGPDGTRSENRYDAVAGATTSALIPAGQDTPSVTSSQSVDENGNAVAVETAYGDGTPGSRQETRYDAFGRPQGSKGTSPFTIEHQYGPAGASSGDTVTYTGQSDQGAGQVRSAYDRDALGNTTGKTLTEGGQNAAGWHSAYDTAGRVTKTTAPGTGTPAASSYNSANGLAETVTRADGASGHYRYDALGRVTESWSSPAGQPDARDGQVRTAYDPLTGGISATWFAADEAGTKTSYSYNPDGSVKQRTDPGGKTTAYTYTDLGRIATVTDHTGAVTTYSYDPTTGRTTGAAQARDGQRLATVSYAYDGSGRLTTVDRGNGATSHYTYDDAGQTTGEKHTGPNGTLIAEHSYTHTPDGKLATDVASGPDGAKTAAAYSYDRAGHLTGSHQTRGETPGQGELIGKTAYSYDLAGNLSGQTSTTATDGKEKTSTTTYRHDTASRTTQITVDGQTKEQTYDAAGRLTQGADGTRHAYNTSGQPTTTTTPDGTTVETAYSPSGERATQTTTGPDGTRHTLTYHPGTETDQDGATATYLIGHTRETRTLTGAGQDQGQQTGYYLTDQHGDKTHTLNPNGGTPSSTTYTDYGTPTTTATAGQDAAPAARAGAITEDPYGYAGQYTTPTGHQTLGTRLYSPAAAAFTTADAPTAGMLNPYTYATGDPVNYSDPTGRSPVGDWLEKALTWEGLPYLDIAIAFAAVGLTLYTGGAGAPLALAMIGAAATLPSAADQIARDTTGDGFLSGNWRLGLAGASVVGAGADIVIGGASTYKAVKAYNAEKAATRAAAAAPAGAHAATAAAVAPAAAVLDDTPSADSLVDLYQRVKHHVPPKLQNAVDEAAFRQAYGNGELSELGQNTWPVIKAEYANPQAPKAADGGALGEAVTIPFDAERHGDLVATDNAFQYLGVKKQDMAGTQNIAGNQRDVLMGVVDDVDPTVPLRDMYNAFGAAVPGLMKNAGISTTEWVKVLDPNGVTVFHNGTVLRGFLNVG